MASRWEEAPEVYGNLQRDEISKFFLPVGCKVTFITNDLPKAMLLEESLSVDTLINGCVALSLYLSWSEHLLLMTGETTADAFS